MRPLSRLVLLPLAAGICVFAGSLSAASAADQSAMVIDANTGRVLYDSSGDEQRYPASLTKMMTLYMTFELIEKGRLKYDDKITISAQAATQAPSKLDLDAGDTITVRNAVLSLVTKSANDIAVALAEHIGGSENNFARLMTRKAREIGMTKTTFRNASGLPNSEQVTTARDMLILALRLQDEFPEHYKLFSTERFNYAGASYRNHNTLLRSYRGTDGIKTGYTRASGFNLVSSVHRGSKHLVAAVFGGKTSGQRNTRMRAILDRSFLKAATRRTRPRFDRPQLIARPKMIERPAKSALAPSKAPPLPHPTPTGTPPAEAEVAQAAPEQAASAAEERFTAAGSIPPPPSPVSEQGSTENPAPTGTGAEQHISIAKVRSVGIAQHFAKRRARAQRGRERDTPATLADNDNTGGPTGPRSISELIASTANADASQHTGHGVQQDGAITPAPSAASPIALAAPASAAPQPPSGDEQELGRGRTPSTLQSQLSRLLADNRPELMNRRSPPDHIETAALSPSRQQDYRAHTRPPPPPPSAETSPANSTHLIQIGAFNTADEAERRLQAIRAQAKTMLASATPITEPVTRGQHRFFRARFAGFDSQGATSACQELRRRSIDCFVAKVQ